MSKINYTCLAGVALQGRIAALVILVGGQLGACKPQQESSPGRQPGRTSYDTAPIDVTGFPANKEVSRHILYMSFGEAAARLGSVTFEARSNFVFSRSAKEYEQSDSYSITQDSRGNFHVLLNTPNNQTEVYLVGETVYVRQDTGHLRHKPRRNVESESWCELAFASLHQQLELFQPRLSMVDPHPEKIEGRSAVRYQLVLADQAQPPLWQAHEAPNTLLPVAPPARWRELARPLDLRGRLWLDAASGVITRISLEGRLEIADRDVRPTQLTIHYEAAMTSIGKAASIHAPKSVDEFSRRPRPHNLLGFFRKQLESAAAATHLSPPGHKER